jgi:hypothetical protein
MNDSFRVQIMKANEDHCEVTHDFIFSKSNLIFHKFVEISTWGKLSDGAEFILVDKFVQVLNNKRMRCLLQNF